MASKVATTPAAKPAPVVGAADKLVALINPLLAEMQDKTLGEIRIMLAEAKNTTAVTDLSSLDRRVGKLSADIANLTRICNLMAGEIAAVKLDTADAAVRTARVEALMKMRSDAPVGSPALSAPENVLATITLDDLASLGDWGELDIGN